jgi:hypothetical protein
MKDSTKQKSYDAQLAGMKVKTYMLSNDVWRRKALTIKDYKQITLTNCFGGLKSKI